MRTRIAGLIAAGSLLALVAACSGSGGASTSPGQGTPAAGSGTPGSTGSSVVESASTGSGTTPTTSGSSGGDVLVGSVNSLTGSVASSGNDVQHGEELAVQIINGSYPELKLPFAGKPGLPGMGGAQIKLVTQDDQGSAETGASAVSQLVTQDHVVAVVGGYSSSVTQTASERAERLEVPFVNGSSSATSLTERGLKWFFRVGPTDATFATTMFQLLDQQAKAGKQVSRIAILHTNDTYGNGVDSVTKAAVKKAGYTVVADVAYDTTTTDLTPAILKIKSASPDVLFDSSYTSDSLLLMRGLKSLGWYPAALLAYGAGFSDPTFLPTLKSDANGVMSRAAWSNQIPNPTVQTVAKMFKDKYQRDMTENSARGFSSVMALATAINDAKSADPAKIRDALEKINIPGDMLIEPWTSIKFDSSHQNTGAAGIVQQVQDGQYKIVFPDKVAVAKVIWPLTDAH